ncbi:ABC transporter permease [Corynebacterium ulceribovis]|uniref:ABC transporter permease n=1 Tax=Corynebacterium ulceribovis TaxID=487732 RepID=UPI00036E36D5|nr:ABC transporter permease [Corynebacterium ulceribovis]
MSDYKYSSASAIKLVAAREFGAFIRNKSVIATFVIMVLGIIAAMGLTAFLSDGKSESEADQIAVVQEEPEFLKPITAQAGQEGAPNYQAMVVDTPDTAREVVESGDAKAALIQADGQDSWRLVSKNPQWELNSLLQSALASWAEANALERLGVDPAQVAELKGSPTITSENLDEEEDSIETIAPLLVALVGVGLMMMAIMIFAGNVGMSVTEEKSSRVVEIMLATVRPFDLLAGKLLGIGAVGLLQMGVLVLIGAIGMSTVDLGIDLNVPLMLWVYLILFFLLGYFFFASMYAATGATVSRSEDLSSAQMPVMLLALLTIYVPMFGWMNTDATFMQVAGWLPPVSAAAAPLMYASGEFGHVQMVSSAALLFIATVAVNWLSARIYRATIMLTGARVTWAKALKLAK